MNIRELRVLPFSCLNSELVLCRLEGRWGLLPSLGPICLQWLKGQALWPCLQAGWEGLFLGCSDLACRGVRPGH